LTHTILIIDDNEDDVFLTRGRYPGHCGRHRSRLNGVTGLTPQGTGVAGVDTT
jgi:hypothetical protein